MENIQRQLGRCFRNVNNNNDNDDNNTQSKEPIDWTGRVRFTFTRVHLPSGQQLKWTPGEQRDALDKEPVTTVKTATMATVTATWWRRWPSSNEEAHRLPETSARLSTQYCVYSAQCSATQRNATAAAAGRPRRAHLWSFDAISTCGRVATGQKSAPNDRRR